MAKPFHLYDTTLRDGAQQEGMNLSVADKIQIAALLDRLGVDFIEGGWPGAIPKDTEFFARLAKEVTFRNATLAAFGATRRAGARAAEDPQVLALLEAETPVVTLVAKSDIRHVERALKVAGPENLAMIADTVGFLVGQGRRVFLDAEHFFDGYRFDPAYAVSCVEAAAQAGAEVVVLCDTNGGMLPESIAAIVAEVGQASAAQLGIHCHNDTGCAVANSLAAVEAGAMHVQGTINGYGERTGNADLTAIIPNLVLKLGRGALGADRLADLTGVAHAISEITNIAPFARQPYVGTSAFAHKAGLHASAIRVDPDLYQHVDPVAVGNDMRMLVSEMAGRASVELKGKELGFDLAGQNDLLTRVTDKVKALEAEGYTFDAADASFELLLRAELPGGAPEYFRVESWRTISETVPNGHAAPAGPAGQGGRGGQGVRSGRFGAEAPTASEATVKLWAGADRLVATGEGNGPVNALDAALRLALGEVYPELAEIDLVDYKVRILDSARGTDAITRVMIESTDGAAVWRTVGVGANIIEASWEALTDAFAYGLLTAGVAPR
ncbi:MAG: citramalate synthase [Bifidobacteriaceae bacterium]|jgi:2-isopropylmalate synthase|nr:citramalate synthase [Bifidobacteriaceae bacterium]